MPSTTHVAILSSLLLQIKLLHVKMALDYNCATQPEGTSTHLNYKLSFFHLLIFPVLGVKFPMLQCKNIFLIFFGKFPVFPVWKNGFPNSLCRGNPAINNGESPFWWLALGELPVNPLDKYEESTYVFPENIGPNITWNNIKDDIFSLIK